MTKTPDDGFFSDGRLEVVVTIPDPPVGPSSEELFTVRVVGAPVRLWDRSAQHTAELMRDFTLLQLGASTGTSTRRISPDLLRLMNELRARYAGASGIQEAEFEAAVEAGDRVRDFTYQVPAAAAPACRRLLELLDAADERCAGGDELMTLVSPPDQRRFRAWYLLEFVRQIDGAPPTRWDGPTD